MSGRITPESSLDQLKQEAKRWLKALRAGVSTALNRFDAALPDFNRIPGLRDVQHALARELGFAGWTDLKEAATTHTRDAEPLRVLVTRFLDNACPDHHVRGGSDHLRARSTAMRMLSQHPEIAQASLATRIVCGDLDGVRAMLTNDPDAINRRDGEAGTERAGVGNAGDLMQKDWGKKGWTPLLYLSFTRFPTSASVENAAAIAQLLLDAGADPMAHFMAGDSRYTPLVGVIGEGEEGRPAHPGRDELVALLLEHGADPFDGQVLYNIHFHDQILWYLKLIYESTVRRGNLAVWDDPAWPMLDMWGHGNGARWILDLAIQHDNVELAEWCLTHGADPNAPAAPSRRGIWPEGSLYELAVRGGAGRIATLLQEHGAKVTPVTLTPAEELAGAAFSPNELRVHAIIAAHPELRDAHEPLFEAARRNLVDVVKLLLDSGVSVNATRADHEVALHQAVYHGAIEVIKLLLERGADANVIGTTHNNTPLGAAVYGRNQEIIDLIAPHSRDIWELVYGGKVDRVRELVAAEPAIAQAAGGGHTLLMWLTPDDERIAIETARVLLANGADPKPKNTQGMTAADRAERMGMRDLAALLRGTEDYARPSIALYETMAQRLLEAYRTGTPAAMERHYADTWHRREWSAMRRYVLADLGRAEPSDNVFPDITLDDARRWIAYDHQFRSWDELVAYLTALPPDQRSVTRSPVGAAHDGADDVDRFIARDWDKVIGAITDHGYTTVHANGQMTDDVLARIARLPAVTVLRLGGSKQLTDAGIASLATMPHLRKLDISGTQLTDRGMAVLRDLPGLELFHAGGTRITDTGAAELSHCRKLQRVDLIWTHTGDGVIRALAGMPLFRHLISGSAVSDAGLSALHDIPAYKAWRPPETVLDLTSPEAEANMLVLRGVFTDRGMAALVGLDGLFGLSIESQALTANALVPLIRLANLGKLSFDAHDDAMPLIAQMPRLRFLGIQDTDATDDGWAALSASQTIEGIWGRRCHGLTSRGFRALATMPALRNLSVSCKNVGDEAIALLPAFPALRELMPMDIPDAGYRHIGKCQLLEKLTLMYCRETGDEATSHLVGLDSLRRYFASYTQISDRTPELLASMKGLQEIEFSAISGITNHGVAALAKSPSLRRLKVDGSPLVTPEVRAAFPGGIEVRVS